MQRIGVNISQREGLRIQYLVTGLGGDGEEVSSLNEGQLRCAVKKGGISKFCMKSYIDATYQHASFLGTFILGCYSQLFEVEGFIKKTRLLSSQIWRLRTMHAPLSWQRPACFFPNMVEKQKLNGHTQKRTNMTGSLVL